MLNKLLFDLDELIQVLEALRDEANVTEIIISEVNGYPAISDANDPTTVLILKPADDDGEIELPRGSGNEGLH